MNFQNVPRKYLIGLIFVMVAILVTVTVIDPGAFVFHDNTDYDAQRQVAMDETKRYEALLASVQPDYTASQQLLEKIATEDLVRKEVNSSLDVNQTIVIPKIADSELTINPRNDRSAMVNYINKLGSAISNYNTEAEPGLSQTFGDNPDTAQITSAVERTKLLATNIRGLPVPQEAISLHKAYLVAYDAYSSFLGTANDYAKGTNLDPWSKVYTSYAVINNQLATANKEYTKINKEYALNVPIPGEFASSNQNFGLIKTANAQWPVMDVQAVVRYGIEVGLARAFSKFAINMLDKLVGHIEKSFAIASQLYYSQDLGRFYSVEYMKKFVADPVDQDIIQKFLPQYFCINPSGNELKQIFTAKAQTNQGTDIVIDPSDPQYLNKLARLGGDEKNYAGWWEDYYTSLAAQTQREAESAASKEVLSPGLKSGRDLVDGQIKKTMSSIFNVQEAAISGTINLGTNNTENAVSQLVATVVESLVNKFVFTPIGGGSSSGGGIGVIAEQNVCLRTPKMKPIAALPTSEYETPSGTSSTGTPSTGTQTTGTTTPTTPPFNPR